MYGIKDKLIGVLGIVGYIAYLIFGIVMIVIPFVVLDFNIWLMLLFTILFFSSEFVGSITQTALYIWAFIKVINGVNLGGVLAVLFWIGFALAVLGIIKFIWLMISDFLINSNINRF